MSIRSASQTVTVDDFESVVQYSNNADFSTPDPSNATQVALQKSAGYYMGTYHSTNVQGATWSLNFTGTSIAVFGSTGPSFGSYTINLDGNTTSHSGWADSSTACNGCQLYEATGLSAGPTHTITFTNGNSTMLLDSIKFITDIGASGSNVKNTTVEETDPALKYVGTWGNNKSPLFSGGGSTYTNEANATVTLNFNGSSIYIWGDTNANHGTYTVTLDSEPPILMKSVTGCGLPYQTQGVCEQTIPGLLYLRSYLSNTGHTIVLENVPGPNGTYFDLDRITYSTPTSYFVGNTSSGGGGGGTSTISGPSTSTPSPSTTHSTGSALRVAAPLAGDLNLFAIALAAVWVTMFWRLWHH
ncbi:hypothetical protein DL93DRAFT_2089189 [Clavulina sp. PMI_390]|nr:hypothetical protein DL93DRAFT_2089189 [Clavulina sp. PMI_390]